MFISFYKESFNFLKVRIMNKKVVLGQNICKGSQDFVPYFKYLWQILGKVWKLWKKSEDWKELTVFWKFTLIQITKINLLSINYRLK